MPTYCRPYTERTLDCSCTYACGYNISLSSSEHAHTRRRPVLDRVYTPKIQLDMADNENELPAPMPETAGGVDTQDLLLLQQQSDSALGTSASASLDDSRSHTGTASANAEGDSGRRPQGLGAVLETSARSETQLRQESALDQHISYKEHIKELNSTIEDLESEKNNLQHKLNKKGAECEKLQSQIQQQHLKHQNELEKTISAGKEKEVSLEEQLKVKKYEIVDLESKVVSLTEKRTQLMNEKEVIENKHNEEIQKLESDLEEKETKLFEMEVDLTMERLKLEALRGSTPYSMNRGDERVGLALIISNSNFVLPIHKKRGHTAEDETLLRETFEYMRYEVKLKQNCTHNEMMELFKHVEKDVKETDRAFVCFIGSHGNRDENGEYIVGIDGKHFYFERAVYATIAKCEILKEKPKIFIVQACRGKISDEVGDKSEISPISDILISYSTGPDRKSSRPKAPAGEMEDSVDECHSSFVEIMCNALKAEHTDTDIVNIIEKNVHQQLHACKEEIVIKRDGKLYRQTPFLVSSLRGRIYHTKQ